jgi:hypothetical protein
MLLAALPSGVAGPVDFFALRRFASVCFFVAIGLRAPLFFGGSKPLGAES